jgi:DNA polymerase-3 subunit alpha
LLGLYVSGHPLDAYRKIIQEKDIDIGKIKERCKANDLITIACVIEEGKPIATKDGNTMLFIKLADFSGSIEAVVFPRTLAEYRTSFTKDACVAIKGKVSERKGEKSIIVERVKRLT